MSEQNVRRNRCDNCTWYDHSEGGLCRRYPPHPKSGLPGVGRVDWCGEWAASNDDDWEDWTDNAPPPE